jgi:RHS repeat-associated protein
MVNAKTRLAEAYTSASSTGSPKVTDLGFSYTPRGEPSDLWQFSLHSGGYYHVSETYWANGVPSVLSASPYYMSWGVDGMGRPLSVTDGGGAHPVTGVTYNAASQPTQITYTTSDTDSYTYDPNTGRMTQYKFTIGATPQSVTGNLTWNPNWTLSQLAITDPFNAANAQTCNYSHDDLVRIASANCGSAASQSFTYDVFGNLNKTGSPFGFSATYSSSSNQMTKIGTFTPTYDANGNVLNDSLHAYTWDTYGNSLTVDGVGLTYDALDRVVEQNRSGSFTQLLYSPTGSKIEKLIGTSAQVSWAPLPGGATVEYSSIVAVRHPDWLGSARFISDLYGRSMRSDVAYAPFGEPYAQAGTTELSFTGKDQDTVSNLYDFPARKYGIQGRWASPDPAGLAAVDPSNPQSWNRYAYVLNNPLGGWRIESLRIHCQTARLNSPTSKLQTGCRTLWFVRVRVLTLSLTWSLSGFGLRTSMLTNPASTPS